VLDPQCPRRLALEAGSSFGWDRWIGQNGGTITLDHFGSSGPYKDLAKAFGFTVENVLAKARTMLQS